MKHEERMRSLAASYLRNQASFDQIKKQSGYKYPKEKIDDLFQRLEKLDENASISPIRHKKLKSQMTFEEGEMIKLAKFFGGCGRSVKELVEFNKARQGRARVDHKWGNTLFKARPNHENIRGIAVFETDEHR
jgi:hypothetical protein